MSDLFAHSAKRTRRNQPLAERMRPQTLEEVVGQEHLLEPGRFLHAVVSGDRVPSMILWGPPGTGKTTLARVVANRTRATFEQLSAVQSGVRELRAAAASAARRRDEYGTATVLFIDEIHRFSKSQQDALLPDVESGTFTLIGATTENPSFEVNAPLLSRCRVVRLELLGDDAIGELIDRALVDRERGLGGAVVLAERARAALIDHARGDARRALTGLEVAASLVAGDGGDRSSAITVDLLAEALQQGALVYDKAGEEHYNVVSAFIKSMRGSDPDAAVYWMTRMLEAGEDPRFVLRRLVIFASEDVGNADPQALSVATSALHAYELVGMPEGVLPLTQAVLYLACAPKSNTSLTSYATARKLVHDRGALAIPMKLRNAPTRLLKAAGYGSGYRYPHDFDGAYVPETYLPDEIQGAAIYRPTRSGYEAQMAERLAELASERERPDAEPKMPGGGASDGE